jgi:peptidoglycan/xylan/chitin deacetylase (PgdA/CDA1 family)
MGKAYPDSSSVRAQIKTAAKALGLRRPRRVQVAAARMWCERNALALGRDANRPRSRILCYHAVGTPAWGVNDVSPDRFRRHLELSLDIGYRFVPAEELAPELTAGRNGMKPGPSMLPPVPTGAGGLTEPDDDLRLAITFDDGLRSVATNAAPILSRHHVPATLFVVGNWADGRHAMDRELLLGWPEIEALAAAGTQIGSHSLSHPDFAALSLPAARQELVGSRELIRERTGIEATTFAIPFGQSDNWNEAMTDLAHEVGYRSVYAQSEAPRPAGTIARTFVSRYDNDRVFRAALAGAFDAWEEWV